MKSFETYQNSKYELDKAFDWLKNKERIDSQDHKKYLLTGIKFSAEYCGQHYAGANNYHDSPAEFNKAMCEIIKIEADYLFEKAIILMRKKLREDLISCENDSIEILRKINSAKVEAAQ